MNKPQPPQRISPTSDEPKPSASEDSVPQDEGTDNSWQMEPLEEAKDKKRIDASQDGSA